MKILVNYSPAEKGYLPGLSYILKSMGITAVSSAMGMHIGELLHKAKLGNCSAILICNEETLKHCVPGTDPTLDKWRGSRLNFSIPTIVCNKLEHIYTVRHGEWLLRKDLEKFKFIHLPAKPFIHEVLEETSMFQKAYETFANSLLLTYDIETRTINVPDKNADGSATEGGQTIITCASWTALLPSGELYTRVLPLVDFDGDHWTSDQDYALAIHFLQAVNKLPQIKAMHNGMYDATHSIRYHAEPLNYTLDTMALAHAEFSELPKTLDFVASYQLPDYTYWKDDSEEAAKKKDIRKYWAYNAKDTWHTMRILMQQIRKMPAYARRNYAIKFKLVYPALYCNFEGLKINQVKRQEIRAKSSAQLEKALIRLRTMFADPNFNPGSWQQVEKYLYNVIGGKKPKIGKSKSCTDEKNLKVLSEQHPLLARLCAEILDYREAQKAIGTYFDFYQMNGRLLYALNPFGTETERMACSASSLWVGTQVQNVPGYAKAMLEADDGCELAEIDNSQSEARCVAYLSEEVALIEALESETHDFYTSLGTLFFNIPYEQVTKWFRNNVLKKIVHGTNYMMGAGTFVENTGVKILNEAASSLGKVLVPVPRKGNAKETTIKKFAGELLEVYHKPFPNVRKWYKKVFNEILTTGMLVSPLGHTRVFFGKINKDHNMLRSAVAHGPQNLSVEILNVGLWKIYKHMVLPSGGKFRLKAQIHDSILVQYKTELRDIYVPQMMKYMITPTVIHNRTLVIPIEAKVGKVWSEAKEYKPPENLTNG